MISMKNKKDFFKILEFIKEISTDKNFEDKAKSRIESVYAMSADAQAKYDAAQDVLKQADAVTKAQNKRDKDLDKKESDIIDAQKTRDAELDAKEAAIDLSVENNESLLARENAVKERENTCDNRDRAQGKEDTRLANWAADLQKEQDRIDGLNQKAKDFAAELKN